jgi:hypothetical protein
MTPAFPDPKLNQTMTRINKQWAIEMNKALGRHYSQQIDEIQGKIDGLGIKSKGIHIKTRNDAIRKHKLRRKMSPDILDTFIRISNSRYSENVLESRMATKKAVTNRPSETVPAKLPTPNFSFIDTNTTVLSTKVLPAQEIDNLESDNFVTPQNTRKPLPNPNYFATKLTNFFSPLRNNSSFITNGPQFSSPKRRLSKSPSPKPSESKKARLSLSTKLQVSPESPPSEIIDKASKRKMSWNTPPKTSKPFKLFTLSDYPFAPEAKTTCFTQTALENPLATKKAATKNSQKHTANPSSVKLNKPKTGGKAPDQTTVAKKPTRSSVRFISSKKS